MFFVETAQCLYFLKSKETPSCIMVVPHLEPNMRNCHLRE